MALRGAYGGVVRGECRLNQHSGCRDGGASPPGTLTDKGSVRKRVGLVVDFVGVLGNLQKALKFDSADVSGLIEDLDLLMEDFKTKVAEARGKYLAAPDEGGADEKLEKIVYGRFLDPDERQAFFDAYKEIEALWEILSPSAELRDHIETFNLLAQLYAAVRNAYAVQTGFIADLAHKTRALVEQHATQEGLGRLTKSVTFDSATLEGLRTEDGSDEGKIFNLVRGLQEETDDNPEAAPILVPLKDRAKRILKELVDRNTTGLAAMDMLAALAVEKERAEKEFSEAGLSAKSFGAYWRLKNDKALADHGVDPKSLAKEIDQLIQRFPSAALNKDEERQFRAALYRPLLAVEKEQRTRIVDAVIEVVVGTHD